jgi:CheY-like chemotaxis protein
MTKQKNVLVVEDDHFLSDIYKRQLQAQGCDVTVVGNGQQGLDQLASLKPDVILLDLIMPGMDGFDFLKAVKALPVKIKSRIIVLTNLGQESDKARCKALGAKDYLVKTEVSVDEVVKAVLG